jgi:hypothetical protein
VDSVIQDTHCLLCSGKKIGRDTENRFGAEVIESATAMAAFIEKVGKSLESTTVAAIDETDKAYHQATRRRPE